MRVEYKTGIDARRAIKSGINQVADIVKLTLGPKGSNVLVDKPYQYPVVSNDGVFIVKELQLNDPFENLGAQAIRQVADKTNQKAGDGTTTSVVIAQKLASEGLKYVETGLNAMDIKRGMLEAKNFITEQLRILAKPVDTLEEAIQVATISVESREIGEIVAKAIFEVGKDGVVTIEDSPSIGISTEVVDGFNFDRGFITSEFSREETVEIKDAKIIITDEKISSARQIEPIIEKLLEEGKKDLVIIADDVDAEALAMLIWNAFKGILNVVAVKAPDFGVRRTEALEDIAILTGGNFITKSKLLSLEKMELSDLGSAQKVKVDKDSTTIISGNPDNKALKSHVSVLRKKVEELKTELEKIYVKQRVAKLTKGVAIVKIGAATEMELSYLRHKIEDAVAATKAAIEEGILPGGGVALLKSSDLFIAKETEEAWSDDFKAGAKTVINSIRAPFYQIVENCGRHDASVLANEILLGTRGLYSGYDAKNDVLVDDMFQAGIIDPLKVTRLALENAVEITSNMLTTGAAIIQIPEEKEL